MLVRYNRLQARGQYSGQYSGIATTVGRLAIDRLVTQPLGVISSAAVSAGAKTNDRLIVRPFRAIGRMIRNVFLGVVIILLLILGIAILLPRSPSTNDTSTASPNVGHSNEGGCGSRGGPGYRLPSGQCASWSSQQNSPAPIVSAPPVPLVSTPPSFRPSSRAASGCGSRGGPGYRLSNGKCASWTHKRHSPKRSKKN